MYEPHDVCCAATAGTEKKEANVNSLVNFDCFAQVVQLAMDDLLREIKPYFAAYVQDNCQPTVKHYVFYRNDLTKMA